jgi:hypothetical protein
MEGQEVTIAEKQDNSERALPKFISEKVTKVKEQSNSQYQNLAEGKSIISSTSRSLRTKVQMETIAEIFPDLKEEALTLVPENNEFHRVETTPEDKFSIMYNTPRERARSEILEKVNDKKMFSPDRDKARAFDTRVDEKCNQQATELIEQAKEIAEKETAEGSVLVIALNKTGLLKVVQEGKYIPTLDTVKFSTIAAEEINERLKMEEGTDEWKNRFDGISPLQRRYLRELELGTYTRSGESSHPVYGQLVVNLENEMENASQEGYGKIFLKLRTEQIKDRTLFVVGDSINDAHNFNQQLDWDNAVRARAFLNGLIGNNGVDRRSLPPYLEAQIMGGVRIEDIEEIVVDEKDLPPLFEHDLRSVIGDKFVVKDEGKGLIRFLLKN